MLELCCPYTLKKTTPSLCRPEITLSLPEDRCSHAGLVKFFGQIFLEVDTCYSFSVADLIPDLKLRT